MARRPFACLVACTLTSLAVIILVASPSGVSAANKSQKSGKPDKSLIRNPKFDSSAEQVDLFEAVDAGHVSVRLIPKDAKGGNVLIENKTDKPLTVKIPAAVVGVSIHAQLGNFGNGLLGNNNNNAANKTGQQMQGGVVGMGQPNGQPNQQNQQNNQGQNMGPFPNFFSIPAERTISLTFTSVCLEHGKAEPNSNSKYTLVPVSRVSSDPVLYQLLASIGTGKADSQAVQAAAWHLTDKMSFRQLADKTDPVIGALTQTTYFSRDQIQEAQQLVAQAEERAAESDQELAGRKERKVDSAESATESVGFARN